MDPSNFDSTGPSRRLQAIATNQRVRSVTKPLGIYESQICSAAASIARDVMTYFKSKLHAFYLSRSQPRVLFSTRYRVIVGKAKSNLHNESLSHSLLFLINHLCACDQNYKSYTLFHVAICIAYTLIAFSEFPIVPCTEISTTPNQHIFVLCEIHNNAFQATQARVVVPFSEYSEEGKDVQDKRFIGCFAPTPSQG